MIIGVDDVFVVVNVDVMLLKVYEKNKLNKNIIIEEIDKEGGIRSVID